MWLCTPKSVPLVVQNTIWTGDTFIQDREVLVVPESVGLVRDARSVSHYGVTVRVLRVHATRWPQWVCLGASLSSHLASLILVCLEGDGWWKWVGALRFKYWWSLAGEIRQMRLIDGERSQKVAGDIFSGGIRSIGLQMTPSPRQWLL